MAVAQHTEWEKKQLESIELLLKNAIQAIDDFIEKEKKLVNHDDSDEGIARSADWLKFRGIMLDLYSVLDYVWYLLYCHFSNKGQPDFSDKGCELGFPYRKRGIKTSRTSGQDKTQEFVKDKLKKIWQDKVLLLGEETHFWKEIGKIIVSVQPKLRVDASGAAIGEIQLQGDEESLALLYFYRNCAAHKDLITFMSKRSWVEINQTTREIRLVTERRDSHEGYFYRDLEKGFWIQLPGSIISSTNVDKSGRTRLLIDVLDQLRKFVVNTASRLLRSALLLPSAKTILEHHVDDCKLNIVFKTPDSEDHQEVIVTATVNGREIVETGTNKNRVYAEEDACVKIIKSLHQIGTVPNAPYSYFTSHTVCPLPDIEKLKKMPGETYKELLDDWKQKLEARNMEVVVECNKHILVTNKHSGAVVFKSCYDGSSTEEAAAEKLIIETVRLGLIKVEDVDHPPVPIITVNQAPMGKSHQAILNEFKQKMETLSMKVDLNYNTWPLEQPQFETELSLTITQRGNNKKVLRLSTDKHKGQGKSRSKEAAAQQMCDECVKRGILTLL